MHGWGSKRARFDLNRCLANCDAELLKPFAPIISKNLQRILSIQLVLRERRTDLSPTLYRIEASRRVERRELNHFGRQLYTTEVSR